MAVKYTDAGEAHSVDCEDPATRAAQTTTYHGNWGSSGTAPTITDTTLGTELPETRVACSISQQTTQSTGDTIRFEFTQTATGTRTVQEFAYFTAAAGGSMPVRATIASVPVETNDQIAFTINRRMKDSTEA
jgi:hypothetical protein